MLVFVMPSCLFLVAFGHLLGGGWPIGFLVCDVCLCFCRLHMWYPGSGVVLGGINSRYSPSSLLL